VGPRAGLNIVDMSLYPTGNRITIPWTQRSYYVEGVTIDNIPSRLSYSCDVIRSVLQVASGVHKCKVTYIRVISKRERSCVLKHHALALSALINELHS
jgi:hypothetical protein